MESELIVRKGYVGNWVLFFAYVTYGTWEVESNLMSGSIVEM